MAKDDKETTPRKAQAAAGTAAGRLKIRWDDSNVRSAYANVFNAAGTREEIVLFFGMNQAWDAGQQQMTVQLTDRIVLSPFAAKRLSMLLNGLIKDYEAKYGSLDVEVSPPEGSTVQ